MSVNLQSDDRRAIDLLLDPPAAAGVANELHRMDTAFLTHAEPVSPERVTGVERVLALLDLLPDEEPPADLLERTLARCEEGVGAGDSLPPSLVLGLNSVPHA